jgi:DNA-binding beta-propeller fold protein YncE
MPSKTAAGLILPTPPLVLIALLAGAAAAATPDFVSFESGQVRALALSEDGRWLYAVNTPDARLEIFEPRRGRLRHVESVPVGMEPVAVAARGREAWVVNHLSDSVSIVRVSRGGSRVVRTLLVGDEPQDIVFGGSSRGRAFVTTAHRGQNSPYPRSEYWRPGVGRADVWVFDAEAPGDGLGGEPIDVLTLFGDKPRALAVSPDGSRVYAAIFRSGNRTTTVTSAVVCVGGADVPPCEIGGTTYPGGMPAPNANANGVPAPERGLIVRFDAARGAWLDELGRDWSKAVRFDLPDLDLFEIDTDANPPRQVAAIAGVGTILYNIAVNPKSGVIYVSNTEARNEVRFEGEGVLASTKKPLGVPASVRGHLHESRITVVRSGVATPRHLNPHIDYGEVPSPPDTRERSLSLPLGMAVSRDGSTLYVAALGSDRIGVFETAELESGVLPPVARHSIALRGGPTSLALDERRGRLYVFARFENALVSVDLDSGREIGRVPLFNPEPPSVVEGRPFLYDAELTSSNGEASCGVCHVFGDVDDLAWDLGDPDAPVMPNPNAMLPFRTPGVFHPMKGPMTTQTLRGLVSHGPLHWRGDRTGGSSSPPGDPLDAKLAFESFNAAFEGLLGREAPLSDAQMSAFADFAMAITPPPNPIRRLDGRLREDEERGRRVFFETSDFPGPPEQCQDCHTFDIEAQHFGTAGLSGSVIKVPQLRTLYQRVGMFGFPRLGTLFGGDIFLDRVDHSHQGAQVRGFGFRHDGTIDRVRTFLAQITFGLTEQEVEDTEAFLMAADAELASVVGQQVTLHRESDASSHARLDLLVNAAATRRPFRGDPSAHRCDLIVKGALGGRSRGWVRTPDGAFLSDRADERVWTLEELRDLTRRPRGELSFTCVPPGSGRRMGIDRDRDGIFDADERRQSSASEPRSWAD